MGLSFRDVKTYADEPVSLWIGSHYQNMCVLKLTVTLVGKVDILKLCLNVKGANSSLFVNLHLMQVAL